MNSIDTIIKAIIQKASSSKPALYQSIQAAWEQIVGSTGYQHTAIENFDEGKLIVAVDSSAWLYHMQAHRNTILSRIQQHFPEVKTIYFKIGKIK